VGGDGTSGPRIPTTGRVSPAGPGRAARRQEIFRPLTSREVRDGPGGEAALIGLAALAWAPAGAGAAAIQTRPQIPGGHAPDRPHTTFRANDSGVFDVPDVLLRLQGGVPSNVVMDRALLPHNGRAEFDRWYGTQGAGAPSPPRTGPSTTTD